jgi:diguanylate cyclase (GGDEF)-like protein
MTEVSTLHNSKIMMVDDESIMIELIQIFLEETGYTNFYGVSDSRHAINEIHATKPDILLLDLVMPEVSGFDILQQLRDNPRTAHLPVVVLTSSSDCETKLKALELGATDFLAKPVDQSELALRIRNTLTFKAYQDQLAYYDSLTGLPNRRLCLERLNNAIERFKKNNGFLSVLNIRLGNFRKVADTYGPQTSDALLKVVSERLLDCVRSSDVVSHGGDYDPSRITAHLGGDEFSILLTRIQNDGDASYVGERLVHTFDKPLSVAGKEIYMPLSIGISIFPHDGETADVLLSRASSTADLVVDEGENGFQFYSDEANSHLKEKMELGQDLRKALHNREFFLVYQPQVDANTLEVKGAEALLRWAHPTKGTIPPDLFIPLAEENGLMIELGTRVLKEACEQSVLWAQQGLTDLTVSVNVSGRQFKADDFFETVKRVITETGANPAAIMIEITESLAMSDVQQAIIVLRELRDFGIQVSVDDFGTGYSSLSYLKEFPIGELKIDKAFVDGLPDNLGDQAISSAIIMMAKKLGYKIVAEGVENQRQADYLSFVGCDLIQGYFYSKPLPVKEFCEYYFRKEIVLIKGAQL